MADYKQIDVSTLTKESIKELDMFALYADAAAREDKEAYAWLNTIVAKNKNTAPAKRKRIQSIRIDYLTLFCGYKAATKSYKPKSQIEKLEAYSASMADLFKGV